jgi:hypothetical protein
MCLRSGPKAAKNFLNLETAEVGLGHGKQEVYLIPALILRIDNFTLLRRKPRLRAVAHSGAQARFL